MSSSDVTSLRTPDSRFQDIPDFPYEPHYLNHGNLRMAYVDERVGDRAENEEVFLCLHGQPTWSYLYRKMIPIFLHYTTKSAPLNRRVVAPDLFGFGRSDKPVDESVYTFDFHRESLLHFIRALNLTNITLVVQDWGGILGLTLPVAEAEASRFKRLIVMNTTIAIGLDGSPGFKDWRAYNNRTPDMNVGALMRRSCKHLSMAESEAYNAPYPDKRYKSGVRQFPNLVMIEPGMAGIDTSKKALAFYKTTDQFRTEDIFMACGPEDKVLGPPIMNILSRAWKNGCYYTDIPGAGHFVQEWGNQVAKLAIRIFENAAAGEKIENVRKIEPRGTKL
ncbi:putative haloalkane dehalogenase [Xylogone sp. PMI_703]|nr:putative haloalkane dehalogenase [Xylogone sp. PMI_703]